MYHLSTRRYAVKKNFNMMFLLQNVNNCKRCGKN